MDKEIENLDDIERTSGRFYEYPEEVKKIAVELYIAGLKRTELEQRIFDMGYIPPKMRTIYRWYAQYGNGRKRNIKSVVQDTSRKVITFRASKVVLEWLEKQDNKTDPINTVIEWYLREVEKAKRKENKKKKGG